MSNVFISYQRDSQAFVEVLAKDVRDLGHAVWFDQALNGGQTWWDQILAEVRRCDVFAFVLTQAALESTACKCEYGYAEQIGKPLLPILLAEGVSVNLLPRGLSKIQYVDYRTQDRDAAFRLARALITVPLPAPLPDPLPAPPDVPISPLVTINEQIEQSDLSIEEQSFLVLKLKKIYRDPKTAADARKLLEQLRRHSNLIADIRDEIDEALGNTVKASLSLPRAPEPELPSSEPSQREGVTLIQRPNTFLFSSMEFVLIPAGEFQMGSNDEQDNERPVHQVQISQPFYLGKYPVTQAQWQAVMGKNPSYFKGGFFRKGDPNQPVETVSWNDVQEFIRQLNKKEGLESYRLPTEAEWEYAARAGSTTKYSFGNDEKQLTEYAWYSENSGGKTHPVGQLKPNAWGLYDMHGNVWEWVQDWYAGYSAEAVPDPQGPSSGSHRVLRGCSWYSGALYCRSAFRNSDAPEDRLNNLGFRLLRTAS